MHGSPSHPAADDRGHRLPWHLPALRRRAIKEALLKSGGQQLRETMEDDTQMRATIEDLDRFSLLSAGQDDILRCV
jgi:hypothetical protein